MEACTVTYIPERLHSKDLPEIPNFAVGERLFRRCKNEEVQQPFESIRLYDLSFNREGNPKSPLCQRDDVLFNTNPENGKGPKYNELIIPLEIKEVAESGTYEKIISHPGIDGDNNPIIHTCVLKLLHDRLPCNYSHCIFRVTYNSVVVTSENYQTTIGRKSTYVQQLRTKCKTELEWMILKGEIWIE